MSEENVEVVRSIYAAWREGSGAWHDLVEPDVEYVNPPDAVEGGTIRGHEAFTRWRGGYETFEIEPGKFIEAGSDVVVIATVRATARGMESQWDQGYVWTVQNGKATRFRWFNDPKQALNAAGLAD